MQFTYRTKLVMAAIAMLAWAALWHFDVPSLEVFAWAVIVAVFALGYRLLTQAQRHDPRTRGCDEYTVDAE